MKRRDRNEIFRGPDYTRTNLPICRLKTFVTRTTYPAPGRRNIKRGGIRGHESIFSKCLQEISPRSRVETRAELLFVRHDELRRRIIRNDDRRPIIPLPNVRVHNGRPDSDDSVFRNGN